MLPRVAGQRSMQQADAVLDCLQVIDDRAQLRGHAPGL
jgi:hypothetical protein